MINQKNVNNKCSIFEQILKSSIQGMNEIDNRFEKKKRR